MWVLFPVQSVEIETSTRIMWVPFPVQSVEIENNVKTPLATNEYTLVARNANRGRARNINAPSNIRDERYCRCPGISHVHRAGFARELI